MAAARPPGGRAARPRPLARTRCCCPAKKAKQHRHPPRPLLPEAPRHDGGGDPPRLRAARARARADAPTASSACPSTPPPRPGCCSTCPPAKIAVIPNGVDPAYRERRSPPRRWTRCWPAAACRAGALLYVGSEEKRKNLVNLAMAYMGLAAAPAAHAAPASWSARARTGRRAARITGPQIRADGLPRDARDPRPHGRVVGAGAAVARGGLRPARGRGHGRRPARRVLARVRARGGGRRRRHPREPARHAVDRRRHREASWTTRARAEKQRAMGLERSRASTGTSPPRAPSSSTAGSCGCLIAIGDRRRASCQGRPTGTGRYLRNLLRDWTRERAATGCSSYFNGRRARGPGAATRPAIVARAAGARAGPRARVAGAPPARAPRAPTALDVFFAPPTRCPLSLRRAARDRRPRPVVLRRCPDDFTVVDGLRRRLARWRASMRASRARARLLRLHAGARSSRSSPTLRGARRARPARRRRRPARRRPRREAARARSACGPADPHRGRDPQPAAASPTLLRAVGAPAPATGRTSPLDVVGENRTHAAARPRARWSGRAGMDGPRAPRRLRRRGRARRALRRRRRRRLPVRLRGLRPARPGGHGARRARRRQPRARAGRDLRRGRAARGSRATSRASPTPSTASWATRRCAPTSSRRGRALAARLSWADTARRTWHCLADGRARGR